MRCGESIFLLDGPMPAIGSLSGTPPDDKYTRRRDR
jgi:hypothetical protein